MMTTDERRYYDPIYANKIRDDKSERNDQDIWNLVGDSPVIQQCYDFLVFLNNSGLPQRSKINMEIAKIRNLLGVMEEEVYDILDEKHQAPSLQYPTAIDAMR